MQEVGLRIGDTKVENQAVSPPVLAEPTTLGDVMAVLRRQLTPLVICTLVGVGLGVGHHITTPKQYYTSATVLVDERPNQLPEELTASNPFVRNDTSLLNEIQVLKSLALATAVVRETELHDNDLFLNPPSSLARRLVSSGTGTAKSLIGLDATTPVVPDQSPEQSENKRIITTASKLQRDIGIERVGLSFSVNISYVGHDPDLSAQLVNSYADAYLADHLNANIASTERTAEWMRDQLAALQRRSAEISQEAATLRENDPTQVIALRDLAQQATNLDTLYQTISNRYQQITVQGSFPVSNGRILTRSITPTNPALPKLAQTVALTTILGLMLGFLISVLREMRGRSFRVGWDIQHYTGQQFLGHLPRIKPRALPVTPPPLAAEIILSATSAVTSDTVQDGAAYGRARALSPQLFWSVLAPPSSFHETLGNIHSNLDLSASPTGCKMLGVTSMLPEEGKTILATNYANMLAKSGQRTLLIDADMQDCALSRALKLTDGSGIADVLRGEYPLPDAIRTLDYTGLQVLPCAKGQPQSFAGDMKYQQNIVAMIAALRNHYDYVIVDLPTLSQSFSAKAMSAQLHKIVLVCEWGKTPRNLVTQYLAEEVEISQKILGIALNNVDMHKLPTYARPGWRESQVGANATAI